MVDLDGTISPIAREPASAVVLPACRDALAQLAQRLDLVAVVSGRAATEAREKVGLDGVEYFGVHGMARWTPEGVEVEPGLEPFIQVVAQLQPFLEERFAWAGVRIEPKGPAVAVHYRQVADPQEVRQALLEELRPVAQRAGLELLEGRMVVELRPPGRGKGRCLERLAEVRALAGLLYLGDDRTDEDAFKAVALWRRGEGREGVAVAVASAEAPPSLLEAADYAVAGVEQVGVLLSELANVL